MFNRVPLRLIPVIILHALADRFVGSGLVRKQCQRYDGEHRFALGIDACNRRILMAADLLHHLIECAPQAAAIFFLFVSARMAFSCTVGYFLRCQRA